MHGSSPARPLSLTVVWPARDERGSHDHVPIARRLRRVDGSAIGVVADGEVLVVDGRIAQVGLRVDAPPGVEVVDASDRIVLPGFIDTHRHLWQTTFRGLLANATLG